MGVKETYNDALSYLTPANRFKFFLDIWSRGAFQTDLINEIQVTEKESIWNFALIMQKYRFLTIIELRNPNSQQNEKYFLITEDNFDNIFSLICKTARYTFQTEICQKLFRDKENFELTTDENLPSTISANKRLNELHLRFLGNDLGYLFLVIMNLSPTLSSDKILSNFMNDAIVRVLQPDITTNRYHSGEHSKLIILIIIIFIVFLILYNLLFRFVNL